MRAKTLKESQEKFANKKAQDKPAKNLRIRRNKGLVNKAANADHKRNQKFKSVKTPAKRLLNQKRHLNR